MFLWKEPLIPPASQVNRIRSASPRYRSIMSSEADRFVPHIQATLLYRASYLLISVHSIPTGLLLNITPPYTCWKNSNQWFLIIYCANSIFTYLCVAMGSINIISVDTEALRLYSLEILCVAEGRNN